MFIGLLLDTVIQIICIPLEKIVKTMEMIDYFLNKNNKKVMVLQVQRLAGLLNFLCHCIIPGRAFTTCFYVMIAGQNLKQHQHVKIREENRLDLLVWKQFLSRQDAFCCPFMECRHVMVDIINMYSNASGKIGFGALSGASWCYRTWNKDFLDKGPSIEYLELFALMVGIIN